MAVTSDIMQTWRTPRQVMRKLLDQGRREDRAIVYLMVARVLIFVAQWPRLSRIAAGFEPSPWPVEINFEGMMTYTFYALVVMLPLAFYGLAAIARLVAMLFGGHGSWYSARLALFWTLLATSPLLLLHGLARGFVGPGVQANLVGFIWLAGFALLWFQSVLEAESSR